MVPGAFTEMEKSRALKRLIGGVVRLGFACDLSFGEQVILATDWTFSDETAEKGMGKSKFYMPE